MRTHRRWIGMALLLAVIALALLRLIEIPSNPGNPTTVSNDSSGQEGTSMDSTPTGSSVADNTDTAGSETGHEPSAVARTPPTESTEMPLVFTSRHLDVDLTSTESWHDAQRRTIEAEIEHWNAETSDAYRKAAAAGDPEAAFALFSLLHACASAPVTSRELEARRELEASYLAANPSAVVDTLIRHGDRLIALCSGYSEAMRTAETYRWLKVAADHGFVPAIDAYLTLGRGLALGMALRGDVGRIAEYRDHAGWYLDRWLATGHAQAFLRAHALARTGLLNPPDPVLALAYLRALKGTGLPAEGVLADAELRWGLALRLDDDQLRDADRVAREICERYFERGCG